MKPRSDVWKHFDKFKNELQELRAKFKHCGRDYSEDMANGTSGLATHVRNKVYNLASNQAKISFQASKDVGVSIKNWTYDKDLCNELYTKMIIIDELPFKFGDNIGFQAFMSGVCPMFRIPSRFKVARDCFSMWNSTYEMLEVAEKYERAFYRYDEQDGGYKEGLKFIKKGIEGTFDGRPTRNDWIVVRKFASCLKFFYDLTIKVSGTSYVTSNLFFHEIYAVHSILNTWVYDIHSDMYEMGQKMLEKFDKYRGDPKKMNKFLFVSVVLDPRHKLQFFVYMLKDMYGNVVGGEMGKDLAETLSKMFNEYKIKMGLNNDVSGDGNVQENVGPVHHSLRLRLQFERDSGMVSHGGGCSDLDEYLSEKSKIFTDDFFILGWWKLNSMRFPVLSQMARDVLAMPISIVASESAFSTGGRIISDFRSSLTPRMVQSLVCAQDWMRKTVKSINVEETHDDMVELEKDISKLDIRAGAGQNTPSTASSICYCLLGLVFTLLSSAALLSRIL